MLGHKAADVFTAGTLLGIWLYVLMFASNIDPVSWALWALVGAFHAGLIYLGSRASGNVRLLYYTILGIFVSMLVLFAAEASITEGWAAVLVGLAGTLLIFSMLPFEEPVEAGVPATTQS